MCGIVELSNVGTRVVAKAPVQFANNSNSLSVLSAAIRCNGSALVGTPRL